MTDILPATERLHRPMGGCWSKRGPTLALQRRDLRNRSCLPLSHRAWWRRAAQLKSLAPHTPGAARDRIA
jgi:hypothetical protein